MNRQVRDCAFLIVESNGTNTTNLFNGNVAVYSGMYTYSPYYYTGQPYDESLNGTLRSQQGGYRFEGELMWNRLINAEPLFQVFNNIIEYTPNFTRIYFSPDASNTAVNVEVLVIPSKATIELEATIARQPLGLQLIGKNVEPNIPTWFKV
jgi:hypothetical protein